MKIGSQKYRPDIDGLRAIAVLSVIGFHAFPGGGQGGFIGVDIFFVISGFLISFIIFDSLRQGNFSFIEFYSRRIRRIFPALLVVLITCYGFGWFVLFADEYKQLGKHIVGGASFVSNFVLSNESGYFDTLAEKKPLLHLWSLGIEEQFYIVWPILLWLAWKRRMNLLTLTLLVLIISFALNLGRVKSDPVGTFYSPQTRFWELLAGSILAYVTLHKQDIFQKFRKRLKSSHVSAWRNVQSLFGASLIAGGFFLIERESHFPGWWAVLPALGTVLIISAGMQAWFNHTVLSNRVLVWFGMISFPLYLWHWPLLSFSRILGSETPSFGTRVFLAFILIAIAWLTYRLIETPIRFGSSSRSKTHILFGLMCGVGCVGYDCYRRDGLTFRAIAQFNADLDPGNQGGAQGNTIQECGIANDDKKYFENCLRDRRQPARYALLGDSKAAALYGGLVRTSAENKRWLFMGGHPAFPGAIGAAPLLSSDPLYSSYQKTTHIAIETIKNDQNIKTVVFAIAIRNLFGIDNCYSIEDVATSKNYNIALDGLNNTISSFIQAGRQVVLVVDNPTLPDPNDCLRRGLVFFNQSMSKVANWRCHLDINRHVELSRRYRDLLAELKSRYPDKVTIFDTTAEMCDLEQGVCLPYRDGHLLYSNDDHISDFAAGLIGRNLNTFLDKK